MTSHPLCDQALLLHQKGEWTEAERLYLRAIAETPDDFAPHYFLGVLRLQQMRSEDALILIGKALRIDPENAEALINYGIALKLQDRHDEALSSFAKAGAAKPGLASASYNSGILLTDLKRFDEALAAYDQAILLQPDFVPALYDRAVLLEFLKRPQELLRSFELALAVRQDDPQIWNGHGVVLLELGRTLESLASFERALGLGPTFPEALINRGNALSRLKRHDDALLSYDCAIRLKPDDYAAAWTYRGILLRDMRRFADAMMSFDRAIALNPHDAEALLQRGQLAWTEFGDYENAVSDMEQAATSDPGLPGVLGHLAYLRMHGGDWRDRNEIFARIAEGLRAKKPVVDPFIYQAISEDPADLEICAKIHAARHPEQTPLFRNAKRPPGKIRLGYVSGEFREQATAYLTAGLYEHHDKERFELVGFDAGSSDNSPMRKRLERAFDRFRSVSQLSDFAAAELIASEQIDILVNLNGYFGEQRTGIFAHRAAPVQVNYLGFPGTLGAPYMDYIIADRTVIPEADRQFYCEKVVYLPDCYQANDSRRAIAGDRPDRLACNLPQNAFVFCNFNTAYKLAPEMFAAWMRLLQALPQSVLWLLEAHKSFSQNIWHAAEAHGVARERIVFAPVMALEKHLARLGQADLFLDTLPYNAHTTASDALWAGVPVLTCQGSAFPGRVASSLLHAVGLDDLVTRDLADYETLALQLARDPAQLWALRARLAENRLVKPLFDTARHCRHLESAYITMIERQRGGTLPDHFSVTDDRAGDFGFKT